jgi:hypothetical protein
LNKIRQKETKRGQPKSLDELSKTAEKKVKGNEMNMVPAMLASGQAYATEGEIFAALRRYTLNIDHRLSFNRWVCRTDQDKPLFQARTADYRCQ